MKNITGYILSLLLIMASACVKKVEEIEGPTMGSLRILADESIKDVVQQEEEIFERFYPYAHLDITYTNERDMFTQLLEDSVDLIITTRMLTSDETAYLTRRQSVPRHFPFATSAIAFITNNTVVDTTHTYEKMISMLGDSSSGKLFVIENVKSGITQQVLQLINKTDLPGHFYALPTKQEVLQYVMTHDNAIGIIDYTDIADSDSSYSRDVLAKFQLLGISRPQDSIQHGFVMPFQYNLQDRKYPFTRELYVINNTGKSDVGIGFASFICGEIGQRIVLKAGLLPKYQTERNIEITRGSDIKVVK
jgi:phosphate transport system substrate-binding protein